MELEYQYLVAKLQQALARDARVSSLDIKVTVTGNRIHLTGCVPTDARRAAADLVASEVLPDIAVKNELTILELGERGEHERIDD
jgi:osmotically-inducible protein OsmY